MIVFSDIELSDIQEVCENNFDLILQLFQSIKNVHLLLTKNVFNKIKLQTAGTKLHSVVIELSFYCLQSH